MKKLAFRNLITLVSIILVFISTTFAYFFADYAYKKDVENIVNELMVIDASIDTSEDMLIKAKQIVNLDLRQNSRITILDKQGNVIADTAVSEQLENHIDRKEVQEAINNGVGHTIRYSETLKCQMIYAAYLGDSGYIFRMSAPSAGYITYFKVLLPGLLGSIALAFVLSAFISRSLSKKMALPLETISKQLETLREGDMYEVQDEYKYEELNTIAQVTNLLTSRINETVSNLKKETSKIHYLLNHMSEGICILDEDGYVILINNVALKMLGNKEFVSNEKFNYYSDNIDFLEFVESNSKSFQFDYSNHNYMITKNRVTHGGFVGSTILFFIDITEQVRNAKMKQMFFSNASHELKTPLTSIQGYTELLANDLVNDEELKKQIYVKISSETKRMSRLINDILTISKLENRQQSYPITIISLNILVQDLFNTLAPIANDRNIMMINDSESFDFYANLEHMNQLLVNLLSNSIKYGRENGWVRLKIEKTSYGIKIKVTDNGIGIEYKHLPHLTERFYRVDKGRSRAIEGTGLGLSIVKHIVQLYDGDLKIESSIGIGTVVTIKLVINER